MTWQEKQILVARGWGYSTKFCTGRLSPFNCNQGAGGGLPYETDGDARRKFGI